MSNRPRGILVARPSRSTVTRPRQTRRLERLEAGGCLMGSPRLGCSLRRRSGIGTNARFSEELVRNSGLPESAFVVVGNDHRLAHRESLEVMLAAVEGRP
ncbi:MAG TPA: hypothetical protein VMV69_29115 [Pirellulales bacterium]|nr:hypothetical protein [Pirellulales bacterium]